MSQIELLARGAARAQHGSTLYPGERLVVVDGVVWGRTRPVRAGGVTEHRIYPLGQREPLEGSARGYDRLLALVEARIADGSFPAAYARLRAAQIARDEELAAAERARLARQARENAEWRARAQQAVVDFTRGAQLEQAILDAMKWARTR